MHIARHWLYLDVTRETHVKFRTRARLEDVSLKGGYLCTGVDCADESL